MHFISSLERSTSYQTAVSFTGRTLLPFLHLPNHPRKARHYLSSARRARKSSLGCGNAIAKSTEDILINALVSAGTCRVHRTHLRSFSDAPRFFPNYHRPRRKENFGIAHEFHTISKRQQLVQFHATKEEYASIVDFYNEPPKPNDPSFIVRKGVAAKPFLEVVNDHHNNGEDKGQAHEREDLRWDGPPSDKVREVVQLIEDEDSPYEDLFQAYKGLRSPGVAILPPYSRRNLLKRMSVGLVKDETVALRYLSLVDDMRDAGLPLTESEWNNAVHLAGRSFSKVLAKDVESGIRLWKRMEHEAGVRGTRCTFNILFDVAVKAGKFVLADMVLAEMKARGLQHDRYTWVGLIYCEGVRGNGDGVRAAYRSLVESGEVVDTVVLNCVIASLIRAGEATAAEMVFERMKQMNARFLKGTRVGSSLRLPPKPLDSTQRQEVGRVLRNATRDLRRHPNLMALLQESQSLTPDLATFASILSYHAVVTGDLDRLVELLHQLKFYNISLHGRIFYIVMRGFNIHGGKRYSMWTKSRLEKVWDSFWHAAQARPTTDHHIVDRRPNDNIFIRKPMVLLCLRAYSRCTDPQRVMEIWEQIQTKWKPEPGELESVQQSLGLLLRMGHRPSQEWDMYY